MRYILLIIIFLFSSSAQEKNIDNSSLVTQEKFNSIISKAKAGNWSSLKGAELSGKIASEFIGTPYIGNTLEPDGPEKCRVNFEGLDCVTFFENTLCLSRIIKKGKTNFDDLIREVTFTRYRNGKIVDYTSRLHYTSDWIYDNVKKGTVLDITKGIGGEVFRFKANFMSKNPSLYSALKEHPEFIPKIKSYEKDINSRILYYIPKANIKKIERFLKTGDIIAVATNKKGLDYSHTGLIYWSDNRPCFIHASSKERKVLLDVPISEYLQRSTSNIGISILRPIFNENK